ncbi:MAG TPA: cache domain-containing protein [Thermoplasmata archaeon]|nr:cache domain-containing protein [Thermoplasmata archaeon]
MKLAAGFIVLLLMLASLAFYSSVTGREALAEGIGLASEAIAESLANSVDRVLYLRSHEVLTIINGYGIANEVNDSNAVFDAMEDPEAYIDLVDDDWTSVPTEVIPESMEEVLENNMSLLLRSQLIAHYLEEHGVAVFGQVIVTNKYGAVIAATHRPDGYRQSDEAWWQNALGDSNLYYSNIQHDEGSGVYGVCTCVPIRDDSHEVIGVARAMVNILAISKEIELTALGYETSELKIITSDGRLIFSSRAYIILQNVSSSIFFELATDERGHFIEKEGDASRLFSYVVSTGYLDYEGNEWLVFLSHSEDEVLGPAADLQASILAVAALAITLGAIIAIIISRSISVPMALLEAATRDMAKGDLNKRITFSRKDEFGRLAESFNEMAEDLSILYSGLDELVKERTKDLETANNKLSVLSSITRHDALNQIVVQKGWLGMAMKSSKDPVINDYLRKADTSTDNLVEFLRFASEYEEIGIEKPEWINVQEAHASAIVGLDLTHVDVSSDLEGIELLADPMFPKILHNLISNSLKHGQKVSKISLSYSEGADGLTIIMEDDGIGIPEDQKDHIFDKVHPSGRRNHGLFLTAEILRMTGISVGETGTPGEGVRFEIFVPRGSYRLTSDHSTVL